MARYGKTILVATVVLGLALFCIWWLQRDKKLENLALTRRRVAARFLGEHLQTQFPRSRVLIVANPYARQSGSSHPIHAFEKAAIDGLKEGWGRTMTLLGVAYPELRPEAHENPGLVPMKSGATTPLSYLTAPGAWEAFTETYTNIDIVVSLIGTPLDLTELSLWRKPKPRFALILPDLSLIGDATAVREAFRSAKLCGVVLNLPSPPSDSTPLDPDPQVEFAKRFLLVTPQNYELQMGQHPLLFQPYPGGH